MLIIALVLALVGLTALVAAVVTSNEVIAWVCIGASVIGVLLLIADALRSRRGGADVDADTADDAGNDEAAAEAHPESAEDYPEDESTVTEPEHESETEVAGVTDADDESQAGGAVEISPDPEAPPENQGSKN